MHHLLRGFQLKASMKLRKDERTASESLFDKTILQVTKERDLKQVVDVSKQTNVYICQYAAPVAQTIERAREKKKKKKQRRVDCRVAVAKGATRDEDRDEITERFMSLRGPD